MLGMSTPLKVDYQSQVPQYNPRQGNPPVSSGLFSQVQQVPSNASQIQQQLAELTQIVQQLALLKSLPGSYSASDSDTWEPLSNLTHATELLSEFHLTHPDVPKSRRLTRLLRG